MDYSQASSVAGAAGVEGQDGACLSGVPPATQIAKCCARLPQACPSAGQRLQRRAWQQALAGGAVERPPVERPARPGGRRLSGVSCTSASLCVAVGSVIENRQDVEAAKQPRGASGTVLNGVSCTGTSFCMAVGSDNSGEANVAEA